MRSKLSKVCSGSMPIISFTQSILISPPLWCLTLFSQWSTTPGWTAKKRMWCNVASMNVDTEVDHTRTSGQAMQVCGNAQMGGHVPGWPCSCVLIPYQGLTGFLCHSHSPIFCRLTIASSFTSLKCLQQSFILCEFVSTERISKHPCRASLCTIPYVKVPLHT